MTDELITDPALRARLALPNDAFLAHFLDLARNFAPREWTEEAFARGLRYPWSRPQRSYLLRDATTTLLHDVDPAARRALLDAHARRVPLLAIGSNAAPKNLTIKLAHHEAPDDREVLVLAGELHGFDVVAAAALTVYGAMPATLAVSPATAVRAALLLVTPAQLTTLTWGEIPYLLGRLNDAPFVAEDGLEGVTLDAPLAFVSRWGAFAPGGTPQALGAIPARGRTFPAAQQRDLLDRAAAIVLGPGAGGAEALTRALFADYAGTAERILTRLREHAQPFALPGWTGKAE